MIKLLKKLNDVEDQGLTLKRLKSIALEMLSLEWEFGSSNLGCACVHLLVDAAVALLDLEESRKAPWSSPWVGAEPVVEAILSTPADDLDGVATSDSTGDVVVDTALVVEEVFIDCEGAFHGSVVVELGLDASSGQGVDDWACLALVLGPGWSVAAGLGSSASGGNTWLGGIWPASLSNGTSIGEILPGEGEVTTVATVVVVVAWDEVLGWENDVLSADAESVGESLGGTESPAWAALSLISDGVDAVVELLSSGVEVGGEGHQWLELSLGMGSWLGKEGSDHAEELLSWFVGKRVGLGGVGFPGSGVLSDSLNNFVVDGVGLLACGHGSGEDGDEADDDELEHLQIYYNLYPNFNIYTPKTYLITLYLINFLFIPV